MPGRSRFWVDLLILRSRVACAVPSRTAAGTSVFSVTSNRNAKTARWALRGENDWHDIQRLVSAAREQGRPLDWELLGDYLLSLT